MTSSLYYGIPSASYMVGFDSALWGKHTAIPQIQTDPLIPGEMYKAQCNGYGFAYIRKNMERAHSVMFDSASAFVHTGGYYPTYETVGNINTNDIVQYIGTYLNSVTESFYKVIKQDEMGYIPVGQLTLKHFTEEDAEKELCHHLSFENNIL